MIIQEDEDLKKEKFDVPEICRCDELSKFYKKAKHSVYPAIRYQDKDFKLEPFEVELSWIIVILSTEKFGMTRSLKLKP